jgi:hypothetical protein
VEDILREYFQHFATSFFVEFVNCVSAFANAKLPNIRLVLYFLVHLFINYILFINYTAVFALSMESVHVLFI